MGLLSNISASEAIAAFEKLGWEIDRQRGSHIVLTKAGERLNLVIPQRREVPQGLLRGLIRDAGITVNEFLALL